MIWSFQRDCSYLLHCPQLNHDPSTGRNEYGELMIFVLIGNILWFLLWFRKHLAQELFWWFVVWINATHLYIPVSREKMQLRTWTTILRALFHLFAQPRTVPTCVKCFSRQHAYYKKEGWCKSVFLPPKAGAVHDRPLLREPPGPQLKVQLCRNYIMKLISWLFSPAPLPPAQPRPINWEKWIWGTDDSCVDRKNLVILTLISETSGSRAFLMICSWNKRHSLAHSFSRQLFVCKLSPLHPVPFAPLLHFLFLFVWPGPHFALHVLHADHLVQAEQEEFELKANKALNSTTNK